MRRNTLRSLLLLNSAMVFVPLVTGCIAKGHKPAGTTPLRCGMSSRVFSGNHSRMVWHSRSTALFYACFRRMLTQEQEQIRNTR